MDITLFIGNGFDKALGLKTGYYDFYDWLKRQQPNDPYVGLMKKRILGNKDLWSDFEKGIGRFTNHFIEEGDLPDDLAPWKSEIDKLLIEYLNSLKTSEKVRIILNFNRNIQRCFDNIHGAILAIKLMNPSLFSSPDEKISIHVISLNYTDALDQIAYGMSNMQNSLFDVDSTVLHPHGRLSNGIVLGVNDETQISNNMIQKEQNYSNIMIKSAQIKEKFPDEKEKALDYIDKSSIICLFGVSLGETDNDWWDNLGNWLQKNENNRLYIIWYLPDEQTDRAHIRDTVHKAFLKKLHLADGEKEGLKERIIVYFHKTKYLFAPPNKLIIPLDHGTEISLIHVEAGVFTMSKKDGENAGNEKEHTAELNNDFFIGESQVTQAQYMAVLGNNPSKNKGDMLPVEQVTWYNAMQFCEELNKNGLAPLGYHFSLPTETQWEYAARGGKKSKGYKYSGSNNAEEVAWIKQNSPGNKTHEVKTKKPNELGIYDMSGNVWEWCLDDADNNSDSSRAIPEFIRESPDKSSDDRVDRGGACDVGPEYSRISCRSSYKPESHCFSIGFRVALVPNQY